MVYALKINSAIFFSSADFSTFDDRIILHGWLSSLHQQIYQKVWILAHV
jgi:hypothetical protein